MIVVAADVSGEAGGFLPSSLQQSDYSQKGPTKRVFRSLPLTPVTIKQIIEHCPINSTNDNNAVSLTMIDGVEGNEVVVVGSITEKSDRGSFTTLQISDGTGILLAKVFTTDDSKEQLIYHVSQLDKNQYVKMIGQVKILNDLPTLIVHFIEKIEDFDEITFHLLDSLHTHLMRTMGQPQMVMEEGNQQFSAEYPMESLSDPRFATAQRTLPPQRGQQQQQQQQQLPGYATQSNQYQSFGQPVQQTRREAPQYANFPAPPPQLEQKHYSQREEFVVYPAVRKQQPQPRYQYQEEQKTPLGSGGMIGQSYRPSGGSFPSARPVVRSSQPIMERVRWAFGRYGKGESGCTAVDVQQHLSELSLYEVTEAIGMLLEEGLLYSMNEGRYKATDES